MSTTRARRATPCTAIPAIRGHFFYNDELTGLNFERRPAPLSGSIERLLELLDDPAPPAVYAGAVPTPSSLPGFARDNTLPLIDPAIVPRVWVSNRVIVPTHYDLSSNIACVVAGRRRFTLFPPEQLVNLYVGPLEFTLAGQPISMVHLDRPDFDRYPKFRDALAQAQFAELEPGDALFIPYMWWHHVESLAPFNVLVNYWWDDAPAWQGSPFEVLLHGADVDSRTAAAAARDLAQGVRSLRVPDRRRPGRASAAPPARHPGSTVRAAFGHGSQAPGADAVEEALERLHRVSEKRPIGMRRPFNCASTAWTPG